ncbi:MAG: hypothetical protein Q9170_005001 [Blastenia crenularia]
MSAFSQPHNYYNNPPSQDWRVTDTDLVTITIATVIVILRCYTKFLLIKSPGWDDYTCIAGLIAAVARTAVDFVGRYQFGAGRHFRDIPPENYNGYITTVAVDGYLYVLAISLAKVSLLLFLYRIFAVDRGFRIAAWTCGAVLTIWSTVTILLAIFSCRPVAASWNVKLRADPKTVCNPKSYDVENIYGFCNVITDVVLMIMPVPLVWHLQMDRKRKIGIVLVFATGAFVCAVAIIRQYIAYTSGEGTDPSWGIIPIKIWMALEVNIAIIIACLPALTPLFKRVPGLTSLIPSIRSKFSHASAMQHAPWPQRLSGPHHDIEQGETPLSNHASHASWKTPRAWREAERRAFGDADEESEGSSETVQSVQALYHAR